MYRAVTGRISRRPSFVLIVKATNTGQPLFVFPTAIKRSSRVEWVMSGATRGLFFKTPSISEAETPCLRHFSRFPSSQSNPSIRKVTIPQHYTTVYTIVNQELSNLVELNQPPALPTA